MYSIRHTKVKRQRTAIRCYNTIFLNRIAKIKKYPCFLFVVRGFVSAQVDSEPTVYLSLQRRIYK